MGMKTDSLHMVRKLKNLKEKNSASFEQKYSINGKDEKFNGLLWSSTMKPFYFNFIYTGQ